MGMQVGDFQEVVAMIKTFDWITAVVLLASWSYKFQYSKAFRDMINDEHYGLFDIALVSFAYGFCVGLLSDLHFC